MDIKEVCVQEIALEGLDGITLPTLWLRLNHREPPLPYKISEKLQVYLWKYILQHPSLQVLQIPEPRNEPEIFNRFGNDCGQFVPVATAPDELDTMVEVYSTSAVDAVDVRGSCSNYHQRINIKDEIIEQSLDISASFVKFGRQRIVIVASQQLRERELLTGNLNPLILSTLSVFCYCVLEKVGRSRWQGVIMSRIKKMDFPHKAYHAIVQKLYDLGLASKAHHTYRLTEKSSRVSGQVLVTLKKFRRESMSFASRFIKRFLDELRDCPDKTMNLGQLKDKMKAEAKTFKTAYKTMKKSGEIEIKDLRPGKRSRTVYEMSVTLVDQPAILNSDDEEDIQTVLNKTDIPLKSLALERPYLNQAYEFIVQNESKGVCHSEMRSFLRGFGKLEARYVLKCLQRMQMVDVVLVDQGKQRLQMYIPKNISAGCIKSKEFNAEKKKMQQLVSSTKLEGSISSSVNKKDGIIINKDVDSNGNLNLGQSQNSEEPQKEKPCSVIWNDLPTHSTSDPNHLKKWDANLTARTIKRHNIILEHVKQEKVITGFRSLQRVITLAEKDSGHKTIIDQHSVIRLIGKMQANGVLRHTNIPVTHNEVTENVHFIMSLDCSESLLKSAIDQARFCLVGKEENRIAKLNQKQIEKERRVSRKQKKEAHLAMCEPERPLRTSNRVHRQYCQPKFKRLRILHQFFWYLTYGHPLSDNGIIIDSDTPKQYVDQLSWKRYLPPAPIHMIGGLRWLQLGDLALIMPLSIFCQFHRVPKVSEELKALLHDEEKCHTLVRHLPQNVKSTLLSERRYMFSLASCIEQLFFMGLVTMTRSKSVNSPQLPKERMMIFVHKSTTVLDTRTSCSKYMKVESKEYKKINFVFDEFQDLESYWYTLQNICMQTRLGCTELLDDEPSNNSHLSDTVLKKFLRTSFEGSMEPKDDGQVPGDGLGAGGLDSSMFSFLYRNWNLSQTVKLNKRDCFKNEDTLSEKDIGRTTNGRPALSRKRSRQAESSEKNLTEVEACPRKQKKKMQANYSAITKEIVISPSTIKKSALLSTSKEAIKSTGKRNATMGNGKKIQGRSKASTEVQTRSLSLPSEKEPEIVFESNVGRTERVKGGRGLKRKPQSVSTQDELPTLSNEIMKFGVTKRRRRKKQQPMGIVKQGKQKRKYVDKVDLKAIENKKGRIRAIFSKAEDALFLLCHVTSSLLVQMYWKKPFHPKKQIISWSVVRDIARESLPESHDKTSYSVARRTQVIMKNPETRLCHDVSVADIKNDAEFLSSLCPAEMDLEKDNTDEVHDLYRKMVKEIRKRIKSRPGLFSEELPDTVEQLSQLYSPKTILCKSGDIVSRRCYFDDAITDTTDIKESVAENLTYISLSISDSQFTIYQAYKAFEEYSEPIMQQVFTRMRVSGFVCRDKTVKRRVSCAIQKHRLAHSHSLSLRSPIPQTVLDKVSDALETTKAIETNVTDSLESIFLTSHFWTKKILDISIDIPEQVVVPETSNSAAFENQFRSALQGAEQDLLDEVGNLNGSSFDSGSVPPDSLIAAAACILKENIDDDLKRSVRNEKNAELSDKKLRIAEVMRLYNRHPSYTNWLVLIKPNKRSESKFAALNISSSSDNIVLNPCTLVVQNMTGLAEEYCQRFSLEQVPHVNECLSSMKINVEAADAKWKQIREERIDAHTFVLQGIFDAIDQSSYIGITEPDLLQSVPFDETAVRPALQKLLTTNIVLAVGIKDRRIVSYKNISPWVAKGYKFKDSTKNFQSEIIYELEFFGNASGSSPEINANTSAIASEESSLKERYEEVKFICRPWHTLSGDIHFGNSKSLLLSIFMKIYSSPGITQEALCATFSYQRICIIELLGVLRDTGCIYEQSIEHPGKSRLFGMSTPSKVIVYYEARDDGLIIVSKWTSLANKMIALSSHNEIKE